MIKLFITKESYLDTFFGLISSIFSHYSPYKNNHQEAYCIFIADTVIVSGSTFVHLSLLYIFIVLYFKTKALHGLGFCCGL